MKLLAAIAALAAAALSAGEAAANAALCRQLESRLAASGKPASGQIRRYDKAIRDQKAQIVNVRAQISEMGCGFFSMRSECSSVKSTLQRMQGNLSELERTRSEMGSGSTRRDEARIMAAIRENGCRDGARSEVREASAARRDATLFERLFGGNIRHNDAARDGDTSTDPSERGTAWSGGGSFRTLCVRTCDGYYFPISYSSSRRDFDRDAKACAAMCPGTDVALFHHRAPQEEAEQAVSASSGAPYSELPNAFAYRRTGYVRGPSCGCGTPRAFSIVAGEAPADVQQETAETVPPTPVSRPDMAEDAETAANRAGGLDIAALQRLLAEPEPEAMPVASITPPPSEREVRVVGPAFLPDPEGAIDLRAPARREIR